MIKQTFAYEETFDCVQCGYCLPVCPTYITLKSEAHSPRGRIHLVKLAAEGKLSIEELNRSISLCLGCRACEVVCPTNVQYGKILDSALTAITEHAKQKQPLRSSFKEFFFGKVIPNKRALKVGQASLSFYQKTGMQNIAQKTKLTKVLPKRFSTFEKTLPNVNRIKHEHKKASKPKSPWKIGFFTGCIMDTMFSKINALSIQLLEIAGYDVTIIEDQTCCGALQQHSGHTSITKQLAKQNIKAFEQHEFDYIVNSIGGCGAMLVEYERLFQGDSKWQHRAKAFAEKNVDISVLLNKGSLPMTTDVPRVVTYQPSCHLSNVQKRVDEPLKLLQQIPKLTLIKLKDAHLCCGSAGIYNLVHFNESMDILDEKMQNVQRISEKIDTIVTTNPGCHLQMKAGVEREGLTEQIEVVHLVELIAEACGLTEN